MRAAELPSATYQLRYGDQSIPVTLPVSNARTEVLPGENASACRVIPVLQ
jgi:hypothetical protein